MTVDPEKQALYATFERLLRLQMRIAEERMAFDRHAYESRAREHEHRMKVDELKRQFVETLHTLRKQLGLPDLATAVQETLRSMANGNDVVKSITDLFGDFFKTDRDSPPSSVCSSCGIGYKGSKPATCTMCGQAA